MHKVGSKGITASKLNLSLEDATLFTANFFKRKKIKTEKSQASPSLKF